MHSSSPHYIGEIKDQLRHGFGVYNYPNSFFKYEGEWRKGKKHGHGKLVMNDGSFYEGQFVNGEMSGVGVRKWARSCNVYEGEFQRGELNGKGVMKYADGSTYEGDWVENMRQGEGKLTIHDGSLYKGSFYKHNKHGDGYETYGDGRVYEGGFICGSKQGHGIMKFSDGSIYEGQWRSDLFNGQGSFIHCSGALYEGIWVNGRPEVDATEIRIEGDEEVELEQGQPLIININCVTADGDVSEETNVLDKGRSCDSTSSDDNDNDIEFDILVDALTSIYSKLGSIDINTRICENELHTIVRPGNDVTIVYLQISISTIDDVDTVKQEFSCQFHLAATWEEPMLKHVENDDAIDWEKQWDPRIYFQNAVDLVSITNNHKLIRPLYDANPTVQLSYRVKGRFKSIFNLRSFPFDYQRLQIHITSKWGDSVVEFKETSYKPGMLNCKTFLCGHEWQLYKHVLGVSSCTADDCTDDHSVKKQAKNESQAPHCRGRELKRRKLYARSQSNIMKEIDERPLVFSMFTFTFSIRRKFAFFVRNILVMITMLSLLSLAPFCVAETEVGDRLSIIFTLLLTAVTFKFVISQSLPRVAYETRLDKYVLANMAYILIITIILGVSHRVDVWRKHENVTVCACVGLWVIGTIAIIVDSIQAAKASNAAIKKLEKAYKVRNTKGNVFRNIVKNTRGNQILIPERSPEDVPVRKSESVAPCGPFMFSCAGRANRFDKEVWDKDKNRYTRRGTITNALLQSRKNELKKRRISERSELSRQDIKLNPVSSRPEQLLKPIQECVLDGAFSESEAGSEKEVVLARYCLDDDDAFGNDDNHKFAQLKDGMLAYKDDVDPNTVISVHPNIGKYKNGGILFKAGLITDQMVADGIASRDDVVSLNSDDDDMRMPQRA
eukprot:gene9794-10793_t